MRPYASSSWHTFGVLAAHVSQEASKCDRERVRHESEYAKAQTKTYCRTKNTIVYSSSFGLMRDAKVCSLPSLSKTYARGSEEKHTNAKGPPTHLERQSGVHRDRRVGCAAG